MGKFTIGDNAQTVALNFNTNAPLDDRTVVTTKASLIGKDTWIKAEYLFKGLITSVQETNELYMYIGNIGTTFPADFLTDTTTTNPDVSDETIAKYWKKVSSSGLENLSGVFQFKGIAEAVSPDLSYIVTCQGAEEEALFPIGTAVDLERDLYYGWQIGSYQIWTDSLFLNSASTQYTREDDETTVRCVVYKGVYYFTTKQVDGDKTILEAVAGHQIKVYTTDLQREAPSYIDVYDGELTGEGYIMEYTAYRFTASPDIIVSVRHNHAIIYASDGTKVVDDVTIPDNSGHVYQIGENEYASNGQIWVKLGSPVEDWIIL